MGLLKAAAGAIGGTFADQWKEFIYCDSLDADTLMVKGQKRTSSFGRSSNTSAEDNIISNVSRIAVAPGQCMLIAEQGQVVELCNEPGEYVYDKSTEPSIFTGDLKDSAVSVIKKMGERFTFGGDTGKDQRVYFFNMKEIMGNKFGTPSEVAFKSFDSVSGQVLTIRLRCFGTYSYHIMNPVLFYNFIAGNVADRYDRSSLDPMLKAEMRQAFRPALAQLSKLRIDYTEIGEHMMELSDSLNEVLSSKWRDLRGLEIVSVALEDIKANEDDEAKIQKVQMGITMADPRLQAGIMADASADALRSAAANPTAGPAMAFMGMGMAGNAGMGMVNQMNQAAQMQAGQGGLGGYQTSGAFGNPNGQPPTPPNPPAPSGPVPGGGSPAPSAAPAAGWTCPACGQSGNTGKFCMRCGAKKPEENPADTWDCPKCGTKGNIGKFCRECGAPKPDAAPNGWTCPTCGTVNQGKFCMNCGGKKPEGEPLYKCDKCGWEPPDPKHPPKFCPQCGDPFDDSDKI